MHGWAADIGILDLEIKEIYPEPRPTKAKGRSSLYFARKIGGQRIVFSLESFAWIAD